MMHPRILMTMLSGFLSLCMGCAKQHSAQHDMDTLHHGPAMNFHRIDEQLATGGHLVDSGAAELAQQGVTLVIDLRDKPPAEERQQLENAGIQWVNVPVVWQEPKNGDFEEFARLMAANKEENILVQCQANYRASAFTYLYRVTKEGVPEADARADLNAIWTPEGAWQGFVEGVLEAEGYRP